MSKKTKIVFAVCISIVLIAVGVVGLIGYQFYSFLESLDTSREVPEALKETGVLTGAEFLTKTELFKLERQNILSTIRESSQVSDPKEREKIIQSQTGKGIFGFSEIRVVNNEIVAVAKFGGYVFDLNGKLKREIFFEPTKERVKIGWYEQDTNHNSLDNLRIVDLEKGKWGVLSFNSLTGATIFDENGNAIWNFGKQTLDMNLLWKSEEESSTKYQKSTHVLEAAVGDLDNDGVAEYIVSKKNEGIYVFDRNGTQKWFQPDEFASDELHVLDLDGDGKNELIETSSKVRNGVDGKVIRELKSGGQRMLLLIGETNQKRSFRFCSILENAMSCTDENEKTVFEAKAPLSSVPKAKTDVSRPKSRYESDSTGVYQPKPVFVKLKSDAPRYLAVIAPYIGIPRANLYVYNQKGSLIYHELLPEDAETISILPNENGNESILVAGKETIWKFSAN